jgi:AraC-like DNA-binding protein
MAILSKRVLAEVVRRYAARYGLKPRVVDLAGRVAGNGDGLGGLAAVLKRRGYALQESVNLGQPQVFTVAPGVVAWVVGLEDRRVIHGGLLGGEVRIEGEADRAEANDALVGLGLTAAVASRTLDDLPAWSRERAEEAAAALGETFYAVSGWRPELTEENRVKALQREQFNRAMEDLRKTGKPALYAFEKERMLLANIRAGDRNEAKRLLNEMLAGIYLSSPRLVVLRARAIELISCLTRAAIEDNPLLEPLIERNHVWTERLIHSDSFEGLSEALMRALDDFMDGIYLHGVNRSNTKVRRALDYIGGRVGERVSLGEVAREVGLSAYRLSHLVKAHTGRTFTQIVDHARVQHAQRLLERTDKTCAEIAYESGFGDQSYFIKHFKRLTGTTPARFRRAGAAKN